jgi:SHS2 domain-containing protein
MPNGCHFNSPTHALSGSQGRRFNHSAIPARSRILGQRDPASPTHLINGSYDPVNSSPAFVQNRKKEGHRLLEHTTDAYIEAWGPTLERAFAHAAEGFYETMLNLKKIDPTEQAHVKADGHDKKELLYNWLETLLLEFDVKEMVYALYDISIAPEGPTLFKLRAKVRGEKYDRAKHGTKTEVKGVTYHLMTIEENRREARVRFILDL